MKRFLGVFWVVLFALGLSGCSKKHDAEELQPITLESMSALPSTPAAAVDLKAQETKAVVAPAAAPAVAQEPVPLPPQGPYKPGNKEIQAALKNAGFYAGEIDGKIGPKSKKAIEEFQKSAGLKADGKVGPKTWEALSKHLNAPAEAAKR